MNESERDKPNSPLAQIASGILDDADRDTLLRYVRTLIRSEQIIDSVYDLQKLLEQIMRESEQAVDAETSSLLLFDPEANDLWFEVALGPFGEQIKKIRLPVNESSIAGSAAIRGEPVNISDVRQDPRWNKGIDEQTQFVTRNLLAVPMYRQDRLIGIIEVINKRGDGPFTQSDINLLIMVASLAAIAIENAQLYQSNLHAERLAALGQAVAGVSHYIKNVLTGLKGSITLIESAVREEEYQILDRAVTVLKRSYGRIAELVKDMLTFSKGRDPEPVPTDPNHTLLEIFDLMVEGARSKGTEIVIDLADTVPLVLMDREVLEKVVMNLVENGIEAIAERKQHDFDLAGQLAVRSVYNSEMYAVFVSDNGVGIPDWEIPKIWTPFYTTKGTTGTGLGLAVSKKLVEDAGGTLRVESMRGAGTTFTLTLPAIPIDSGIGAYHTHLHEEGRHS